MTRFSFRGLVYALVILLGLLSAAPNILPDSMRQHVPQWYSQHTLSLGLDLQGGSHLLLEADTDALFARQLDTYSSALFSDLREQNIRYVKHASKQGLSVQFTLSNPDDFYKVKQRASEVAVQSDGSSALLLTQQVTSQKGVEQQGTASKGISQKGNVIVLELTEEYQAAVVKDAINRSLEVVRKRLDETGLTEPSVTRQGSDAILVQMPGISDPANVKALLGTTAQMRFHWQTQVNNSESFIRADINDRQYLLEKHVALEGEHITDAAAVFSPETSQPVVTFRLDNEGARQFATMTKNNIGRVLAVVLDDTVVTAPVINSVIPGGRGEITGSFTMSEAQDVALMLRTGALPVPLHIIEERTVGPDLGSDAIETGVKSGIAGALGVLVFMLAIYGRWGAIASLALTVNMALVFGVLTLFGATLTLPGIAGLILTMGMAVDANILINERIREETKKGRPAGSALKIGFEKAFGTIVDSNFTTLIAVSLLFVFGSGPVKGFAVTIAIGLITSLFTSVALTKLLMQRATKKHQREPINLSSPLLTMADKLGPFNFLKSKKLALSVSLILTLCSMALFFKPGLQYGVDFTGGTMMEISAPQLSTEQLRTVLKEHHFEDIAIQEYGAKNQYLLRAPVSEQSNALSNIGANTGASTEANTVATQGSNIEVLKQVIQDADSTVVFNKVDVVGPKVSDGFADLSILALLIAGGGMLAYLWFQFEAHFATAALLTVLLDLTKTIGFIALTGIEFNLTAVAALLALIGYSINDKVVVLDRVRELLRISPERSLADIINEAVNSTLSRTVFTSLTTLLALLPMALVGGDAVSSFAVPMVFAVVIGTSSTLFITSSLLHMLGKRREQRGKTQLRPTAEEVKASLAHIP
ncbi:MULTISPECIES: protein translocase subunit SecDF [Alteromonas]|uniref:Multifunctional fusion protein n=1 Tax=Alteromonas stellipolaris TaxID=233316 RepID=A0ABM5YHD8_9ALTE|nr:protein translocase subunit SecDF [Alteromonas stellipolaris]ALM91715.1 Protein-export membrane protein SecD [Alteromonas stellipolaris LMG 21856]AMJ73422.1 preprotein translocase subunit SecD [Alteromonas stellipolaris]MDO6534318.1 protein translocase subunit SecDF [Alteromonas stellipolaris]MDO6624538.1 protein translocase subunit SecDF [Alteromonas stellipolaris]